MKTLVLGAILALMASAESAPDSPAHFSGAARIQLLHQLDNGTNPNGGEIQTTAESMDLTERPPRMLNRWSLRFPFISLSPWKGWAWVTGMCDGNGAVWMLVANWGMVSITPSDRSVWDSMRKQMSFETRWQFVTITEHEIIAEEPLNPR